MPVFELTDDEAEMLIRLVRRAIDNDRYPLAPRLDPPKPAAPLPPPLPAGAGPTRGRYRRR